MHSGVLEKPALLIIDMVKDTFDEAHSLPITPHAKKIVAPINNYRRNPLDPLLRVLDSRQLADVLGIG